MVQVDPWEKAADCERAKQTTIDPHRKAIFERLRDLWIALGNKRVLVTETQWATDIEALNRLHLEWTLAEAFERERAFSPDHSVENGPNETLPHRTG